MDELVKKRFDIIQLLKDNDEKNLEKYVKDKNIKLNKLNTYDFDILMYAIENNFEDRIVECIINMKHYETLNYYTENNTKIKTPFVCAIESNKFNIADLLLRNGYDINYSFQYLDMFNEMKYFDIIDYLYSTNYFKKNEFSCYGLMYLLNNGYTIKNKEYDISMLDKKDFNEDEMEILLKFSLKDNKSTIQCSFYKKAITNDSIKLLCILYDNDSNEKNNKVYNIYKEYRHCGRSHSSLRSRRYDSFKNDVIYYFLSNNNNSSIKYSFLNNIKYNKIIEEVNQYIKDIMDIENKIDRDFDNIKNDIIKYKKFINDNTIDPEKNYSYNFDILIYAIENEASEEVLKYIVSQYNNRTLNYNTEIMSIISKYNKFRYNDEDYMDCITYTTPFLSAIKKNNLTFAKYMLSNSGINVNYEPNDKLEPSYIFEKDFLNDEKLKFLIKNNYNNAKSLIKYCIYDINCKYKEKYLRIIYNHFYYDNYCIMNLLSCYANNVPISTTTLSEYIEKEKGKVLNDDIYEFLFENGNKRIIKQILKYEYDQKKKKSVIEKYNIMFSHRPFTSYKKDLYFRNGTLDDLFEDDDEIDNNLSNEDQQSSEEESSDSDTSNYNEENITRRRNNDENHYFIGNDNISDIYYSDDPDLDYNDYDDYDYDDY
ncbi:hypothetical protein BCR36DRAFT_584289 [Piromyces finnis]|uniref:Ankyrin n=1 Tax=Piromyces finnis TaxID=1754191 RepID=A0A1Y1V6B9_9FUNG|nr:hypothetical protein BCR36DRAFT_584289 [Piromyces finnis]|eukprot:ORX48369.1 hypothetical protein BCR36DRAFT_584289 [Piromyces finnis]